MTETKSWNNRKLESVLHRAADNLSATEVATLVEFPDAVRLALIVAANALSSEEVDDLILTNPQLRLLQVRHHITLAPRMHIGKCLKERNRGKVKTC